MRIFRLVGLPLALITYLAAQSRPPASQPQTALREAIAEEMKQKPGAVEVLDVRSGKSAEQWNLPLAARRLTAPGSTVKPIVLAELLRLGRIDPSRRLVCRRPFYISGRRMDCSHSSAITDIDAVDAIAYSCNSYFAAAATNLHPRELAELFRRVGFTSLTGLARQESSGKISIAEIEGQLQLQALGEWGIEITPLELAIAYRNLALQKFETSSAILNPVFDGLERSVQYGMAHAAQPIGITAAGKTGTAASPRSSQTHGFFVGYAPADKPEIVVMVYVENGRGSDAAALAAPVFSAFAKTRGVRK